MTDGRSPGEPVPGSAQVERQKPDWWCGINPYVRFFAFLILLISLCLLLYTATLFAAMRLIP